MMLLVVGSLHLDVVVRAPHLPAIDETVVGTSVDYVFGGKGGNQAVAAAQMGTEVSFAGRVGSDGFGEAIRAALRASEVELSQLQLDPGPSGMSTAIVDAHGEYGAVIVSAANLLIDETVIRIPSETSLVVLQNEVPESVNLVVARKARAAGAQVWLNAAPARSTSDNLLAEIDLLIVNRVEAGFYDVLPDGLQVLTTLGGDGVRYDGQLFGAHRIDVVSTHGAGDMFIGALAARVVSGAGMEDAIGFAQAAAALHVSSGSHERKAMTPGKVAGFLAANPVSVALL